MLHLNSTWATQPGGSYPGHAGSCERTLDSESDERALRAPDPVALHVLDAVRPVQALQVSSSRSAYAVILSIHCALRVCLRTVAVHHNATRILTCKYPVLLPAQPRCEATQLPVPFAGIPFGKYRTEWNVTCFSACSRASKDAQMQVCRKATPWVGVGSGAPASWAAVRPDGCRARFCRR